MGLFRAPKLLLSLFAVVGLVALGLSPASANGGGTEPPFDVIAEGLDNPRGIEVDKHGAVYFAEAGRGGTSASCIPDPEGGPDQCLGATGAISVIPRNGVSTRIVVGLPSFAGPDGSAASGPSDIELDDGRMWITTSLGADPTLVAGLGPDAKLVASVLNISHHGAEPHQVGDIAAYEAAANPDGAQLDTNPVSIAARVGQFYVADAGGNSLLLVRPDGVISTVAVFPAEFVDAPPFLGLPPGAQIPMDAVPTSVEIGPDGALYVSQLTGFPFPIGGAKVWRVVPGEEPTVFADGFTNIMDIAFGPGGALYVLEIATNSLLGDPGGAVWKVNPNGTHTLILGEPLFFPGGMAISNSGDIYVTNCGICAGGGQVIRINR